MKYALLLMGRSGDPDCAETGGADPSEVMAFDKESTEAGGVVGGFALDGPVFGARVGESSGEAIVTSGPFAEAHALVAGRYVLVVANLGDAFGERMFTSGPFAEWNDFGGGSNVIEVANLDEGIGWAKKSPGVKGGHIELRPVAHYRWIATQRRPPGSSASSARKNAGGCS